MKSRTLQFGLAFLVFFQATELSRLVYTQFGLAPDCPIVGQTSQSNHCELVCHSSETDNPQSNDASQDKPRSPDGQTQCRTCEMFATIHTADIALGEIVSLVQPFVGSEIDLDLSAPLSLRWRPSNSRAPPAIVFS